MVWWMLLAGSVTLCHILSTEVLCVCVFLLGEGERGRMEERSVGSPRNVQQQIVTDSDGVTQKCLHTYVHALKKDKNKKKEEKKNKRHSTDKNCNTRGSSPTKTRFSTACPIRFSRDDWLL